MKTVFILGAGASAESGAPTMPTFIQTAKELHERNAFGAASIQIQDVLDAAYKDLKLVQVKSSINYKNVEELFSAIDIAQLIHCFGTRQPARIPDLRTSIITFIFRTIEETVRIPFVNKRIGLPKGYDALSELVRKKVEQTARLGRNDVSFITFNYDTCLEFALVRQGLGIDYGLPEPFLNNDENNYQFRVPVLKLHGSINWATCPKCGTLHPTEVDPYRRAHLIHLLDSPSELKLQLGTNIAGKIHLKCGAALDPIPFLVPPTWNKSSTTSAGLQEVWRRAAKELGSAENIVVIGYSLPPTDTFFKYLFALGTDSDVHLEKFIVINGPNGQNTEARFKALLGPMTADAFKFYPFVFSGVQHILKEVLGI